MSQKKSFRSTQAIELPVLLTKQQVADYFSFSVRTIEDWRYRGYGPKPIKLGSALRWRLSDIESFIEGLTNE